MGGFRSIAAVAGLLGGCLSSPPDDGELVPVEMMTVSVDCSVLTSEKTLEDGVAYRLEVAGVNPLADGVEGDAEYFWNVDTPGPVSDELNGIDVGLAIDDLVFDDSRTPDWGDYRSDHEYEVDFIGKGERINAQFHDTVCDNNLGVLELVVLGPPG